MKILLVYPEYPDTFWSFKHALKFISKKASLPPLGLLTVAAMLPEKWEKKLVDITVEKLKDEDIKWADYVFISAMSIQRESVKKVISRCNGLGAKVIAGGPLFKAERDEFAGVDHFVLNEAEITLPLLLEDLKKGSPRHVYETDRWADVKKTPIPLWELIDMKKYAIMCVQYSRGCPFDCDFCDVTLLFGNKMRTKSKDQILEELDIIYSRGWRGTVFLVDDNFIGNKKELKREILPALIKWNRDKKYPFSFFTQVSMNLSDDEDLMRMMVEASFNSVFIGIETPNEESLAECGKFHNKNRDMIACVKKIQQFGLQVQGGFIVGFDSDPPLIFEKIIAFIQKSGIVTAMVGLLNAPRGTKLYKRLVKENRMLKDITGDNTDSSINFIPKMNRDALIEGYRKIVQTIYSPKHYYERVKTLLRNFKPLGKNKIKFHFSYLSAFLKSMWLIGVIGIKGKGSIYYWKLLLWSLLRRPKLFPMAVTFAVYGFHFRKVFENLIPLRSASNTAHR